MTKEALSEKLVRTAKDTFEAALFSPFFGQEVKVFVFSKETKDQRLVVSNHLVACVNDFMAYGPAEKEKIMQDVFIDFITTIQDTDYAMVPDRLLEKHDQDYERANQEYFNIYSKEAAFRALVFDRVGFIDYFSDGGFNASAPSRHFGFFFQRPWDVEHELQLEFENGKYRELS